MAFSQNNCRWSKQREKFAVPNNVFVIVVNFPASGDELQLWSTLPTDCCITTTTNTSQRLSSTVHACVLRECTYGNDLIRRPVNHFKKLQDKSRWLFQVYTIVWGCFDFILWYDCYLHAAGHDVRGEETFCVEIDIIDGSDQSFLSSYKNFARPQGRQTFVRNHF